ncbi:TetR/AcrR family transcriptional regulator [Mucilaginibacter terrae]|uniref:TetR/AcrR family transcriptional regulator n=1 Tax=Mucilaginibacter terrae TaxID=1955052 RepID=A0ABU3H0D1_9SPHI|nr:TetR/AcrR family transcriptional regulator [Mucilaginibacter terrae]MDT3405474.1 TetR/AcrR family transcriptional regulator [Mucilaginibacter terrae]
MAARDTGAEQLIKDTAKHVFFAEGKIHAGTQEIADAAGVSRTLLNYYFRSKDVLIEQVFKEAVINLNQRLDIIMQSEKTFRKKIEEFIEVFLGEAMAFPYQETFLISVINSDICKYSDVQNSHKVQQFLEQIKDEMDAGRIEAMNPIHFMMNLSSLLSYPMVMAPIYKEYFDLSKEDFSVLIKERKQIICKMIFK